MLGVVKDFIAPGPGLQVEAELTVGDKTETIATDVTGKSEDYKAETITITNIDETPGLLWSLMFFVGLFLPGHLMFPPLKRLWQRMKP